MGARSEGYGNALEILVEAIACDLHFAWNAVGEVAGKRHSLSESALARAPANDGFTYRVQGCPEPRIPFSRIQLSLCLSHALPVNSDVRPLLIDFRRATL